MLQVRLRLTIRRPHRHEVSLPAWTVAQFYELFPSILERISLPLKNADIIGLLKKSRKPCSDRIQKRRTAFIIPVDQLRYS
jgi:hypothetical protein